MKQTSHTKINLNFYQLTGFIVFILWSMGKIPYGILCWIIPLAYGTIIEIIFNILKGKE